MNSCIAIAGTDLRERSARAGACERDANSEQQTAHDMGGIKRGFWL